MSYEDLGFQETLRADSKLATALSRGFGAWVCTAALVGGGARRFGASLASSAVGAIGAATVVAKMVAGKIPAQDDSGADLSKIHLSLNVGEVVLFPLAAGLALALSSDDRRRKDSLVLLGTAALGAGATAAVLSK